MRKVLCFGDSNTYGFIPENGGRYDENTRWTGVLQKLCKNNFQITEAGANNRNGFTQSAGGDFLTGFKVLPALLSENFDAVILAIGINDLQKFYNNSEDDIQNGIENLIKIVQAKLPEAKILLAAPSKITPNILNSYFAALFDEKSIEKSFLVAPIYQKTAEKFGCEFVNLENIAEVSNVDGLHYPPQEHSKIANAFYKILAEILL